MYGKIYGSLWDGSLGTKWQAWTVLVYMVANCDKEGFFDVTPEALSARSGLPLQVVKDGISLLESEDPSSRRAEESGARIARIDDHRDWGWQIVNYQHYRTLIDPDLRREQWRESKRRHRQQMSSDVHECPPSSTQADREAEVEVEESKPTPLLNGQTSVERCDSQKVKKTSNDDPERMTAKEAFSSVFWPSYPRKVARSAAEKAFLRLVKDDSDDLFEDIMGGLEWYKHGEWNHRESDKIPYAATWLNQRRFTDAAKTPA